MTSHRPDIYDYLIVGAGLTGAVTARALTDAGKRCLVIDKRDHIGGNLFTKTIDDIDVHWYGPHIFHTNDAEVWNYINRFAVFNRFTNTPIANYKGEIYNLPFNMNTFNRMWGVITPQEAYAKIQQQSISANLQTPSNLEEQAIALVGTDLYEKLIKGYTQKQWGRPCNKLPASIMKRLPVRFTYDNNYFNALYQGVPTDGYTAMVKRMLDGIDIKLQIDFLSNRTQLQSLARHLIYTGSIDAYFQHQFGSLQYRSVRFELETLDIPNYQGNAVVNYTDLETPYTRIIEHKHFVFGTQAKTIISREYPSEWRMGNEPFYPIHDTLNQALYKQYEALAQQEKNVLFAGRLGTYQYLDMDSSVRQALDLCKAELENA